MKFLLIFLCFGVTSTVVAQETPTEKEAAREVLRKMAALGKSLDMPALLARLTAANPARDQVVPVPRNSWIRNCWR